MLNINQSSFWEYDRLFDQIDHLVVGSGIVGLTTALTLREKHPQAKIVIFERGLLPSGASTKNAGFTCFGSPTELLSDLKTHSEKEVIELIRKRWRGLQRLFTYCGIANIDYHNLGSYELFTAADEDNYTNSTYQLSYLNELVESAIGKKNTFSIISPNRFPFKHISGLIHNQYEGQIDTGKMMLQLLRKVHEAGVLLLNGVAVHSFSELEQHVELNTSIGILPCQKLYIATNGLTSDLLPQIAVQPARAQVLITSPIRDLAIKGTFHYDAGYYYFRNVGDRILLGGGRNLAFDEETTTTMETTPLIMNRLKELLTKVILPGKAFEIERSWAGIMGVGNTKSPIVKNLSVNVRIGVRLGGMGVAIGSLVGEELAGG
jgi:gamma-glutamylputrescine oxidase